MPFDFSQLGIEYADYEFFIAATQLVFAMLGMGATLHAAEFLDIARRPGGVAFALVTQYVFVPLLALGFGYAFGLSPAITVGLIIVAALPSGSLSNIFTYLGKGNVPLSITATCASTLACLVLTPLVLQVLAGRFLPDFEMPVGRILRDIICFLLLPLAAGMWIAHRWEDHRRWFSKWCIRTCLAFLTLLVVSSLTSGRIDVFEHGLWEPFVIVLFGGVLIGPLQIVAAKLCGFSWDDAFTLAIEIMMRNCNVGILLVAQMFPANQPTAIGSGAFYVVLFYGGASLFLGMTPIIRRKLWDAHVRRREAEAA